jgi:outer membrane protein OmpA-like peptidoglycan-associated protein
VKTPNGYAFSNTKVTIQSASGTYEVDINLIALKPGAKLLLKDIYFEYNSPELYENSYEELLRVIQLMKEYPNMVIEIDAHTDDIGNELFNQKLSEKRALYVENFLLSKDVPISRLQAKGFGETLPVVANDTESHRLRNRRLELKVIKI